ncbi:MAG: hypothetical protein M3Z10_05940 [Gemmatimonadota bacterium]|nr:hypothetical protein [Gemmatimonadota bacterium]
MRLDLVLVALAGCLASAASSGCRSATPYEEAERTNTVTLVVQNENHTDMNIYAVAGGLATRIGRVGGNSTGRFEVSDAFYNASDFRIDAAPVAGGGRATTGLLSVASGLTVQFTIAPNLRASSVIVLR